jgi:hypothetical protein
MRLPRLLCDVFHTRVPVVQRAEFDGQGSFSAHTLYVCPDCEPGCMTPKGKIDPGGLEYLARAEKEIALQKAEAIRKNRRLF